jgi:NTP pyrophosphatase (non-canonical NTP hydrolase)
MAPSTEGAEVPGFHPPAEDEVTHARDLRQARTHAWCVAAFGDHDARSVQLRGLRLVEEAIEAAQAAGCDAGMVHRLVDHVYAKPVGELVQELGGVSVTLLNLAQAAGFSADRAERLEIERVLSRPLADFAARNAAKKQAGFDVAEPSEPENP